MANLKVSEMQTIRSVKSADLMYVIQDGISSNISVANLFGKLPDTLLSGSLQLDTLEAVIENGGDISDNHVVTALSVDNIDRQFYLSTGTIDAPLANFMLKVVYLKTQALGKAIIRGGLIPHINNVTLMNTGDAAVFLSTPAGWIYLCGTADVTRN